jgi:predicted nucleic acid-binding protein
MIVVLDASGAIEIALNKKQGKAFKDILKNADLVLSPDIYPSEITNVFWKYGAASEIPVEECGKGTVFCLDLIDDYINTKPMCREAFSEAIIHNHPAYDIFYLLVARRNDAILLTKDKKVMALADKMKVKYYK